MLLNTVIIIKRISLRPKQAKSVLKKGKKRTFVRQSLYFCLEKVFKFALNFAFNKAKTLCLRKFKIQGKLASLKNV